MAQRDQQVSACRRSLGGHRSGRYGPGLMRTGVLTGGGDCPGLNAAIRAIVRKGVDRYGHAVIGFRGGWRGVRADETSELTLESTRGIIHRRGAILGSSSTSLL